MKKVPPIEAAAGETIITSFAERRSPKGRLKLYEPTHCVMDRLASYYHWNDAQGLEQAVMVARRHRVRLREIDSWSRRERMTHKYRDFTAALRQARRTKVS